MNLITMAIGNTPAAEGIGGVISSMLLIIGTLALIYGVLAVMDRYHKKHYGDDKPDETPSSDNNTEDKTFPQVLSEQIRKSKEKDGDRRI